MAKGFDELVEFLLSEIALCGAQGASSADFRRFIRDFYLKQDSGTKYSPFANRQAVPSQQAPVLDEKLFKKVWQWIAAHPDVQFLRDGKELSISLKEFEALEPKVKGQSTQLIERQVGKSSTTTTAEGSDNALTGRLLGLALDPEVISRALEGAESAVDENLRPGASGEGLINPKGDCEEDRIAMTGETLNATDTSEAVQSVAEDLPRGPDREQSMQDESVVPPSSDDVPNEQPQSPISIVNGDREGPERLEFDETESSSSHAPRIFVSQDLIWHAVAGHPVDYKRLPNLEFELLSIIASRGAKGILQPDLVRLTGQDKRSVPHRTDQLAEKGYIEKKAVSVLKMRTSQCIHTKFVEKRSFAQSTVSPKAEDVWINNVFILPNFVGYLYALLKDTQIVLVEDLKKKLNIPHGPRWGRKTFNSSLQRLEEVGLIKRVKAKMKGSIDQWARCVKLLRAPTEEDYKSLNFARRTMPSGPTGSLEEDDDGDEAFRDLDLEAEWAAMENDGGEVKEDGRIPPQWTPEQQLANLIFEATQMKGSEGINSNEIRRLTMGNFWKRPLEAHLLRLTEDWERNQPPHLRHLAIIRDTNITQELRLVHYIYRTFDNFQQAVNEGQVSWEAVMKVDSKSKKAGDGRGRPPKPKPKVKDPRGALTLDQWGFPMLQAKEFHNDGSATIRQCRHSVKDDPSTGQHWDKKLFRNVKAMENNGVSPEPSLVSKKRRDAPKEDSDFQGSFQLDMQGSRVRAQVQSATKRIRRQALELAMKEAGISEAEQVVLRNNIAAEEVGSDGSDDEDNFDEVSGTEDAPPKSEPKPKGRPKKAVISRPRTSTTKKSALITVEERIAMGLNPRGRLPKNIKQLVADFRARGQTGFANGNGNSNDATTHDHSILDIGDSPGLEKGLEGAGETSLHSGTQAAAIPDGTDALQPDQQESTTETTDVAILEGPVSNVGPAANGLADPTTGPNVSDNAADVAPPIKRKRGPGKKATGQTPKRVKVDSNSQISSADFTPINATTSPAAELSNTQPSQSVEDAAPSADAQTPTANTVRQPTVNMEQMQGRVLEIMKDLALRNKPGLYIDKSITRKRLSGRGRMPKALMAIFKLPQLKELSWFQENNSEQSKTYNLFKPDLILGAIERLPSHDPTSAASSTAPTPSASRVGPSHFPRRRRLNKYIHQRAMQDAQSTGASNTDHPLATPEAQAPKPMQASNSIVSPGPETFSLNAVKDYVSDMAQASPRMQGIAAPEQLNAQYQNPYRDSLPMAEPESEPIADAPPVTANADSQGNANNSPDVSLADEGQCSENGPNLSEETIRAEPAQSGTAGEAEVSASAAPENTTVSKHHDESIEIHDARIDQPKVEPAIPRPYNEKRAVVLGGGSLFHLRSRILLEIMNRCHGIFPGYQQEIAAPFYALWSEMAPRNFPKPDRTTFSKAIKNLLASERLKLLTFAFKTSYGMVVTKRLLTLPNIDPLSPELKAVQRKMVNMHPRRYFPDEISNLVEDAPMPGVTRKYELETELEVESLFPAVQRLQERIIASKEQRVRRAREAIKERVQQRALEVSRRQNTPAPTEGQTRPRPVRLDRLPKESEGIAPLKIIQYEPPEEFSSDESVLADDVFENTVEQDNQIPSTHPNVREEDSSSDSSDLDVPEPQDEENISSEDSDYQPSELESADEIISISSKSNSGDAESESGETGHQIVDRIRSSDFDKTWEVEKAGALMSPRIDFHSSTGTFATDYRGEQNAQTICRTDGYGSLPKRVEDIYAQRLGSDPATNAIGQYDSEWLSVPEHKEFFWNLDHVLAWEMQFDEYPGIADAEFMNHTMPGTHMTPASLEPQAQGSRHDNWTFYGEHLDPKLQSVLGNVEQRRRPGRPRKYPIGEKPKLHRKKTAQQRVEADGTSLPEQPAAASSTRQRRSDHGATRVHRPTIIEKAPDKSMRNPAWDRWSHKHLAERNMAEMLTGTGQSGLPGWQEDADTILESHTAFRTRIAPIKSRITKDKANRLFYAGIVVGTLAGGANRKINWNIVETKVYPHETKFSLLTLTKWWNEMQKEMATQIKEVTEKFQARFIEAYSRGELPSIDYEHLDNYDWNAVIDWAQKNCAFEIPDSQLPTDRSDLTDFYSIEEVPHQEFSRDEWTKSSIPSYIREQRLIRYPYAQSLHPVPEPPSDYKRAKSWIRANIASPSTVYDGAKARDKLSKIGEPLMKKALHDLLQNRTLRPVKAKRTVAGRNFDFTASFAVDFRRALVHEDFIDAVAFKKALDEAFQVEDPELRKHRIGPATTDGALMALSNLLANGRVRFVARLPEVNSAFNAPLPRLSVWGFVDGDYRSKNIDRKKLFWPIDIVPTISYVFGNGLSDPQHPGHHSWALPHPPLPEADDENALVPLWSDLCGTTILWGWWERTLLCVVQIILFQAGVGAEDVSIVMKQSIESWEVDMVMLWLEKVGAVTKTFGGRYMAGEWFWAVFGDKLKGQDEDGFGEVLKRKRKPDGQGWRVRARKRTKVGKNGRGATRLEADDDEYVDE